MVRFDVEPPVNGQCLDFLRMLLSKINYCVLQIGVFSNLCMQYDNTGYEFIVTGADVPTDACGNLNSLPGVLQSGVHGSSLMVDFRSNRINTGMDFFLALTCTLPLESVTNGQNLNDDPSTISVSAAGLRAPSQGCTRSQSLTGGVGTDPNRRLSAKQYLVSYNIMLLHVCTVAMVNC